jgi:hypothetical protein
MVRRSLAAAGIAIALAAATAAAAAADSLTFIKDHNVWIANPDGSGQRAVTLDGTAANPYESPSQSDDGTVVAVREAPGQRRRLYRMNQSGALLNPPVDTPAPGTGAINAKVSPNGALVAYWFLTTVRDPTCVLCVDIASRVLISRSDRFTGYDEVGTPNTGGWPSWVSNDTIVVGSGSPTQWYYKLGMPEAAEWFADSDVTGNFRSLLDAEAAPRGDRLAVVRGDSQEGILLLRMSGPPPALPSIANASCALYQAATGRIADPTWSSDGRLLAWQQDDGVWVASIPADLANCAGFGTPALRIAGAEEPDLSPAPVPAPVPVPCGNPGNPGACVPQPCGAPGAPVCPPPPCGTPGAPVCPPPPCGSAGAPACPPPVDVARALRSLLSSEATTLRRRGLQALSRSRRHTINFEAASAGTLTLTVTAGRTVVLRGRLVYRAAGRRAIAIAPTRKGKSLLRKSRRLRVTLQARFAPAAGAPTQERRRVELRRR